MTVVALSHGYPPLWNMGGEVSLHRTLQAINEQVIVLTKTNQPYLFEGINVQKIIIRDVLNINADSRPLSMQLRKLNAKIVIVQNELSLPTVLAAREINAISIINVHNPPKYGRSIRKAMYSADYAVYNTQTAANEWGEPNAIVVHPPINLLPPKSKPKGDAYTLLSSLYNKGVTVVLDLAKMYPHKRFIIVRSPAEKTHGIKDLEERAAELPNVELHPRVPPEEVYKYLEQTRILLVPSMYETYGMSAIEAAGYGIPCVHVDTPHVREGIGEAAILIKPLSVQEAAAGIELIESNYKEFSRKARERAEWIQERQKNELKRFADFIANVAKPANQRERKKLIAAAMKRL